MKEVKFSELGSYADKLTLNRSDFDKCMKSKEAEQIVRNDFEVGQKLEVKGTPTFFINGYKVVGAMSFDSLDEVVKFIANKQ